jgi:hypothetical protein
MDRNIIAINHYYAGQEAAAAVACYSAAAYHGLSNSQADRCDEGSLNCPQCPFKTRAQARPNQLPAHINFVPCGGSMDYLAPDVGDRRFFALTLPNMEDL